jgi:hypothetical protein
VNLIKLFLSRTTVVAVVAAAAFALALPSIANAYAHGLIRNKLIFRVVARLKGLDRSVKAGVYDLPRGAPELMQVLHGV